MSYPIHIQQEALYSARPPVPRSALRQIQPYSPEQPRYFTHPILRLKSNTPHMMSSSSDDVVSPNSSHQEPNRTEATPHNSSRSEGILAGAKQQIDSLTGGASVIEIKDNVAGVAGEKMTGVKETVLDGAAPAATGALQTAQDKLRSLASGNGSGGHISEKDAAAHASDCEHIDRMDTEHVCDFLRDSHMSRKPPPAKG